MNAALAMIAKTPVAGRSKTRLCPPCTPVQAAELADAALRDTLDAMRAAPAQRRVVVLDGPAGDWLPEDFELIAQSGDGLGERLANAFAAIAGPTVMIGMDTPQAKAELLSEALAKLSQSPSVLGLALDGGYWCIGLQTPDPRVFDGVPMSTPHTGATQLARLLELGLRPAELPVLRDVDDFADAQLVAREAPGTRFALKLADVRARAGAP